MSPRKHIQANVLLPALLLTAASACALPPSAPGALDPTYGTGGVLAFGVRSGYEEADRIVPTPDGKWLVSGIAQTAGPQDRVRYLLRLHADGNIDTSFGAQGFVNSVGTRSALVVQATGRIVIGDQVGAAGDLIQASLHRLLPDGSADAGFGVTGGATVLTTATAALPVQQFASVDLDGQGRILAGANLLAGDLSIQHSEVWRFSADGIPDAGFGNQGRVYLDDVGPYLQLQRVRAQADGKTVVLAWCQASRNAPTHVCVIRLNSDGTRDASFGTSGLRDIPPPTGSYYPMYDLQIGADEKIYFVGSDYFSNPAKAIVIRLNSDGSTDSGYGVGGIAALTFGGDSDYLIAIHLLPDGKQIVFGYYYTGQTGAVGVVARLTANGQLDQTFGTSGYAATASSAIHVFMDGAVLADGSLLAIGQRYNLPGTATDIDTMLVRFVGVETTGMVIEFYNSILNHFFITADPNEAAAIDGGAAGPGWARTGKTFKSGGPSRVCRFYGSTVINPATGTRLGPNSHFYTIDPAECAAVKNDVGWHFESYDFSGWPKTGAACQADTVAVLRTYNNRFAQNDSNHRYTIVQATYDAMLALGWSGEGTVFCAPQ